MNRTSRREGLNARFRLGLIGGLLLAAAGQAQTTNRFTGANAGQWSVAGNWSLSHVPTSSEVVESVNGTEARIGGTTAAVASNLTVGAASGTSTVSIRSDSVNSLTVGGNITLAPGLSVGQLYLGVGGTAGSATLTIGGGSGAILDGGGTGVSRISVYGHMGTLGLATATVDELNVNQSSSGSLTIGAGQAYTILSATKVGSATASVTDALTVNGALESPSLTVGASAASGANNATFTLNTGGLIRATTLSRSGNQTTAFDWNGGTITHPSGGKLTVQGTAGNLLTLSLAGTGTRTFHADSGRSITVAASAALADKAGEAGSWEKTGEGVLLLLGTNTYTGAGTVRTGAVMAVLSQSLPGWNTAGRYSVVSNAALALSPSSFSDADVTTLVGAGHLAAGAHLLWGFDTTAGNATNASALADNASRAMGLGKFGANKLTLSEGSTYTGATFLYSGSLRAAHADALGSGGDITFKGGTLAYTTNAVGKDWSSRYRNSTSAIALDLAELADTAVVTNRSDIGASNTGGLTLSATGGTTPKLALLGANAYTGGTRLVGSGNDGPHLQITNDVNLGSVPAVATPDNLSLTVGRLSCGASMEIDSRRGISVKDIVNELETAKSAVTVTYGGVISGTGGFRPIGYGLLRLTGTNSTFSGDLNMTGTGAVEVSRVANAGQPCSIGTSALIQMSTAAQTVTLRYVGVGDSTDRGVKVGNGNLVTHTGGAVLESSGTGVWRFTNPSFNTSQATDADRTLTLGGTNAADNAIDGVIADNSPTGKISVAKSGAGKWLLNGACTYTGGTSVNAGTLLVGGSLSSSAVTVASNALFGASGTAAAQVAALTLQEGARVAWTYDGAARTGGIVRVTGTLTLPSKAVLEVSAASAPTGTRVLFESGSPLEGATDLSGWSLSGAPAGAHVVRQGSAVVYRCLQGTLIRVY